MKESKFTVVTRKFCDFLIVTCFALHQKRRFFPCKWIFMPHTYAHSMLEASLELHQQSSPTLYYDVQDSLPYRSVPDVPWQLPWLGLG